jgi:hypothetical protein
MASENFDPSSREALAAMEAIEQLHRQLLDDARALLAAAERPAPRADEHVQGYAARLGEAERDALCATLRANIQALEAMTETLEELRVSMQTPPEGAP